MLELLLGADDFSKKQYLKRAAKADTRAEFFGAENCPGLDQLTAADLFGKAKVFILDGCFGGLGLAEETSALDKLAGSPHQIFFLEEKLDKRRKDNLKLLNHPKIKVQIFDLPQGDKLKSWVKEQAGSLGIRLKPQATSLLLANLGISLETKPSAWANEPNFSLHQIYNELVKLGTYADGGEVGETMVSLLVPQNTETAVWDILNAVADRKAEAAFWLLEKFYEKGQAAEEKDKTIQLNASLSEQFRNILATQDFLKRRLPDSQILEKTAWKSGRLYIMKRLAAKFESQKLRQTLEKLASLDVELKTSPAPARVLLEFICAQVV